MTDPSAGHDDVLDAMLANARADDAWLAAALAEATAETDAWLAAAMADIDAANEWALAALAEVAPADDVLAY